MSQDHAFDVGSRIFLTSCPANEFQIKSGPEQAAVLVERGYMGFHVTLEKVGTNLMVGGGGLNT